MKKIYNTPSLQVMNVKSETILAGSEIGKGTYTGTETLLGRQRGSYYYDDEDDDF